jgi:hypothetical protein
MSGVLCVAGVGAANALSAKSVGAGPRATGSCFYPGAVRSSRTFSDPAKDSGASPDIKSIAVLERCDRYVGFKVILARPLDEGDDELVVAVDLDQNPDTGSAYYGTEVQIGLIARGDRPAFYRAQGWDFRSTGAKRPRWGIPTQTGPNYVIFFVKRAALGLKPSDGFRLVASSIARSPDTAPNFGTFNYQRVPGKQPPSLGPDRRAPKLLAYDSTGARDGDAKLQYWVLEGRGKTRQVIRMYRGPRILKTIWTPLANVNPFALSDTTWKVRPKVRGGLRYCVRSFDAAGNRSDRVCAHLEVH